MTAEDTLRAGVALRCALSSRGVPDAVYLDNGSPFVSSQLLRACASLGIRMIHSRPGRPQGRGKIERYSGRFSVPTNASWLNRIEAQFQALRYFALDGTDHRSHDEQNSMIRRYIAWRNCHAKDEALRELVKRRRCLTRH